MALLNPCEDPDDWLFSSTREYDDLHMYTLETPTTCMTWHKVNGSTACGGGELLLLGVPQSTAQEIMKSSDFKMMCGGFHDQPVCALAYAHQSGLFITCHTESAAVQLWTLPPPDGATNLLKVAGEISHSNIHIAVLDNRLMFGSDLNDLHFHDLTSNSPYFTLPDCHTQCLCGLQYIDPHVHAAVTRLHGHVILIDTRQPFPEQTDSSCLDTGCLDTDCLSFDLVKGNEATYDIVRLSSAGCISVVDVRKPKDVVTTFPTGLQAPTSHRCLLQCCPTDKDAISISGHDGNVYIYNLQSGSASDLVAQTAPCFVHRGHTACTESSSQNSVRVTTHMWHHTTSRQIFSAATDGTLHSWQYSSL